MNKQGRNLQHCGEIKISRSLADWFEEITNTTSFTEITDLLDRLFNKGLIDRSDSQSVYISDEDAYTQINEQLISTDTSVDDIAEVLHKKELYDLLYNLVDIVVKRKSSRELLSMKFFFNLKIDELGKKISELYLGLIQRALDDLDKIKTTTAKLRARVEDTLQ